MTGWIELKHRQPPPRISTWAKSMIKLRVGPLIDLSGGDRAVRGLKPNVRLVGAVSQHCLVSEHRPNLEQKFELSRERPCCIATSARAEGRRRHLVCLEAMSMVVRDAGPVDDEAGGGAKRGAGSRTALTTEGVARWSLCRAGDLRGTGRGDAGRVARQDSCWRGLRRWTIWGPRWDGCRSVLQVSSAGVRLWSRIGMNRLFASVGVEGFEVGLWSGGTAVCGVKQVSLTFEAVRSP
jgi:hypothetical protein